MKVCNNDNTSKWISIHCCDKGRWFKKMVCTAVWLRFWSINIGYTKLGRFFDQNLTRFKENFAVIGLLVAIGLNFSIAFWLLFLWVPSLSTALKSNIIKVMKVIMIILQNGFQSIVMTMAGDLKNRCVLRYDIGFGVSTLITQN